MSRYILRGKIDLRFRIYFTNRRVRGSGPSWILNGPDPISL